MYTSNTPESRHSTAMPARPLMAHRRTLHRPRAINAAEDGSVTGARRRNQREEKQLSRPGRTRTAAVNQTVAPSAPSLQFPARRERSLSRIKKKKRKERERERQVAYEGKHFQSLPPQTPLFASAPAVSVSSLPTNRTKRRPPSQP